MKEEPEEIDTEYTNNIICPYCGNEDTESYEYHNNDGETNCNYCGEEFYYRRDIEITYCTRKI